MREICRFPYFDQQSFPMIYIAFLTPTPINGTYFSIHALPSRDDGVHNGFLYVSAEFEQAAAEIAYRLAHNLATPRVLFSGANFDGIGESSARIWLAKNETKHSQKYRLEITPYQHVHSQHIPRSSKLFQINATPLDWLQLELPRYTPSCSAVRI